MGLFDAWGEGGSVKMPLYAHAASQRRSLRAFTLVKGRASLIEIGTTTGCWSEIIFCVSRVLLWVAPFPFSSIGFFKARGKVRGKWLFFLFETFFRAAFSVYLGYKAKDAALNLFVFMRNGRRVRGGLLLQRCRLGCLSKTDKPTPGSEFPGGLLLTSADFIRTPENAMNYE